MRPEFVAITCYIAAVAAHGKIVSPPARAVGPAMTASCGSAAVAAVNSDDTIPLEDVVSPAASCTCLARLPR